MIKIFKATLFFIFIFSFTSCKNEISRSDLKKIDIETNIVRFEKDLFLMNQDTISLAIKEFDNRLNDFFEIFS